MGEKVSQAFVNMLILAMILTGAGNTIVYNLQNKTMVTYEGNTTKFNHPFMQAITMFIGEGLCFLLFINYKRKEDYKSELLQAQAKGLKIKVNYFWLMVPAGADLCTSTLQYISLNYISPSIYQMLRGGVIVVTALFSIFFLGKKLTNQQILGCSLTIVGIGIVGLSNILFKQSTGNEASVMYHHLHHSYQTTAQVVAMMLILLSLLSNGVLFVSEEKLFSIYYMHPFQVVGAEGCWGLIFYLILMPFLTFIQCPETLNDNCVEHQNHYHFERPDAYWYEITHNWVLFILVLLGVFTIAVFNICGVSVTKYISSVARSVVDVTRTVIVWLVGLIITWINPSAAWENTDWQAIVLELVGFIMLVCGNMIYNNIIKLPMGKDKTQSVSDLQVSLEGENHDTED